MHPVKPDLVKGAEIVLSTGVEVVVLANADVAGVNFVVSRWAMTKEERESVLQGEDVFLVQSTNDHQISPAYLFIGREMFENITVRQPGPGDTVPTDSEGEEDPSRIRITELL